MSDPHASPPPSGEQGHRLAAAGRRGLGHTRVGLKRAGEATGHGASYALRGARRAARAEGAGESGLARLIEMSAVASAGDAAVAISLAGTLFFASPGEARGHIALFLGLTMLPFAVVAPLLGPFLDRFSHGRRWAIGGTLAIRGFLCWLMADAVASKSLTMFPAALGVLVASKAYGIARSATVPRLLPTGLSLVKANSRISLSGVVGASISAPLAGLAASFGAQWSLRYAFVVFVFATILSMLVPAQADASEGEQPVSLGGSSRRFRVSTSVIFALRCNAGLRLLSGFLTMYVAFLFRAHPLNGLSPLLLMGLVAGSAGLGNTVAIAAGSVVRRLRPRVAVVAALLLDAAAAVLAALLYGLPTIALLGFVAGVTQAMGKLALDATIQGEVPERNRTAAFARSETLLQLAWVAGGFIGIALPLIPRIGLGTLAVLMVAWAIAVLARPDHRPSAQFLRRGGQST